MHQMEGSVLLLLCEYQIKITEKKNKFAKNKLQFPLFSSTLNANINYLISGFYIVLLKGSIILLQIIEKPIKPTFPEENKKQIQILI